MPAGPPTIETKATRHRMTEHVSRWFGGSRRLWIICALLVATTFAVGVVVVRQLRQDAIASSVRELTNLGVVLAEQTSRTIQSVDLILREAQLRTSSLDVRSPTQFRTELAGQDVHQFLISHMHNLPQAEAIALIDASGALVNWSRQQPVAALDVADRDYFRYLSQHDDPNIYISHAIEGRTSGKWIIILARRISGPDGTFLGVAVGLVRADYLEDFFRTISMRPGEAITVLARDGTAIAGYPDIANRRGKRLSEQSEWYERVAEGGGPYNSHGFLIGLRQIVTVHPLHDYPLVVDVNMSEKAVLARMYEEASVVVIATITVALGFTVLFSVIAAQFRRQEEQNAKLNAGASALVASERKLKAYAEMSADWFWEQDADLRFSMDSRIPHISLPTDVGMTRWEFADPAMDPRRWDAHKADLAARRPFRDFRWERLRTDGTRGYMSTSGDPIFDDNGTFLGYHGTGRDVTGDVEAARELRLAKEHAEAANRSKSEFLANMSHELRTPLHAIIGFAELMQDKSYEWIREKYVEWSGDILNSGRHLLDVINGVLELSRIEAGRYDLSDDEVDLAVVIRGCVGMVRLQAEENRVSIDCAIGNQVMLGDRRAMRQIVLNLLTNAVKFTPPGGAVSIRAEPTANEDLAVIVTDNGIGIEPSALASLCEPFTQADASISRKYGGTGLGLAISSKLMVLHGGTLTIESTPGQGTTVRITIPAARVITKPQRADAVPQMIPG
jgi:signal transduction histidine kinase